MIKNIWASKIQMKYIRHGLYGGVHLSSFELPGHGTWSLQGWSSTDIPTHWAPPCAGCGLSHALLLLLYPCSHEVEQGVYSVHKDQAPFTETTCNVKDQEHFYLYTLINYKHIGKHFTCIADRRTDYRNMKHERIGYLHRNGWWLGIVTQFPSC